MKYLFSALVALVMVSAFTFSAHAKELWSEDRVTQFMESITNAYEKAKKESEKNYSTPPEYVSTLQKAIDRGDVELVDKVYKRLEKENNFYPEKITLKHLAGVKNKALAEYIINNSAVSNEGIDPTPEPSILASSEAQKALQNAVESGNRLVVNILLTKGMHIDGHEATVDEAPLGLAIAHDHGEMALNFIKRGANPNLTNRHGSSSTLDMALNSISTLKAAREDLNKGDAKLGSETNQKKQIALSKDLAAMEKVVQSLIRDKKYDLFPTIIGGEKSDVLSSTVTEYLMGDGAPDFNKYILPKLSDQQKEAFKAELQRAFDNYANDAKMQRGETAENSLDQAVWLLKFFGPNAKGASKDWIKVEPKLYGPKEDGSDNLLAEEDLRTLFYKVHEKKMEAAQAAGKEYSWYELAAVDGGDKVFVTLDFKNPHDVMLARYLISKGVVHSCVRVQVGEKLKDIKTFLTEKSKNNEDALNLYNALMLYESKHSSKCVIGEPKKEEQDTHIPPP